MLKPLAQLLVLFIKLYVRWCCRFLSYIVHVSLKMVTKDSAPLYKPFARTFLIEFLLVPKGQALLKWHPAFISRNDFFDDTFSHPVSREGPGSWETKSYWDCNANCENCGWLFHCLMINQSNRYLILIFKRYQDSFDIVRYKSDKSQIT